MPASPQPSESRRNFAIPTWAEQLVRFLDDGFVVPGTSFRIGFDAIIGLIPGVGDLVTTTTSLSLVVLAYRLGISKAVLARMLINLGVDSLVGAVPLLGDLFDLTFKANRRNLTLLERHVRDPRGARASDRLVLVAIVVAALLVLAAPVIVAIYVLRLIFG